MEIETLANNAVVVSHDDVDRLFSYDSLVAYHVWGELTVTAKPFVSRSTEKHIELFAEHVTYDMEISIIWSDFDEERI